MKILVVGNGGREHALTWKLARDSARPQIYCAPGNAGTAALATNLALAADNLEGLREWAIRERPALTVIGPEAPLCAGLTDMLEAEGLRVFGPSRAAAQLEKSKIFTKQVLQAAGVPTGRGADFTELPAALDYVRSHPLPLVVKADGLAAGKGVIICRTTSEAEATVTDMLGRKVFGEAGARLLVEECLTGREISLLALVDGQNTALLPSAQDHKRIGDGDRGPNTGGMGAYSPAPWETTDFRNAVLDQVFKPTLRELRARGITYRGVLYAGLMLTSTGPKVLEFNCRFGDPETQVILPRLRKDLIPALEACIDGNLKDGMLEPVNKACACVVMAAEGYPGQYRRGDPISGLEQAGNLPETVVFQAGVKLENGHPVTNGGRVLGVTALGATPEQAVRQAYHAAGMINFPGAYMRQDIGHQIHQGENS